jgi:membrane-associated phospholipid phosphatase
MRKRGCRIAATALLFSVLLSNSSPVAMAQGTPPSARPIEPGAGTWRTWVISSGKDLRLAPPPDDQATKRELEHLNTLLMQGDAPSLDRVQYWDAGSPSYRWNEIFTDIAVSHGTGTVPLRAAVLMNVAIHDALIAAWDSKYAHNRKRPHEADPRVTPVVAVPRSPSYPCEHSVAAGAAATVLAHLFPKQAQRLGQMAEEASRSRVTAGAVFPSGARAGLDLGRAVGARVLEYAKTDEAKWSGTVPVGPGLWKGTEPGGINEVRWKTFALTAASEFRPGPPPAPESAERAAELAEVKNFKRTPLTNGKALYWQFNQYGTPGLLYRLGDEVGRRLAEAGLDRNPPRAARAYALVHVAHYDAYVASQDAKFHYWTARPNQFDPTLTTVVPTPNFPSYPSNAASVGMAAAHVLSHLFPREASRYTSWADEFGESRIWAGIHFRSDLQAGWELGRRVGMAVSERARRDGAE